MSELKVKVITISLICLLTTLFPGCNQKYQTDCPPASSEVSLINEEVYKPENPDILEDYLPVNEDKEISVTAYTDKPNKDLEKLILEGEIIELAEGDCLDLNGDGVGEIIRLEVLSSALNSIEKCLLTVANRQIEIEIANPTGKLYAAILRRDCDRIQLFIDADGPSADPQTHIFEYEDERLWNIGEISNYAKDITLTQDGFSGYKRGEVIQTWCRPADYILAVDSSYENYTPSLVVEIPRDIYPMGTVVTLLQDLPLRSSRSNTDISLVIKSGLDVCLVATDDKEWVYISPAGNSQNDGGWLQLKRDSYDICLIEGRELPAQELFDGLDIYD